jgi:protein associated with RNAse G/E
MNNYVVVIHPDDNVVLGVNDDKMIIIEIEERESHSLDHMSQYERKLLIFTVVCMFVITLGASFS